MKLFDIDSEAAINEYLKFINWRSKVEFDPAIDLHLLKDQLGNIVFTMEEADYYERKMDECFLYCVFNKMNIYSILRNINKQQQFKLAA